MSKPKRSKHLFAKHNRYKKIFTASGLLIVFVVAWNIQANLLLNWDVSWDLLATKRLLAGGSYAYDFFDLNPPLIFYLFAPARLLAEVFSLNEVFAFRLYLFGLVLFSWMICSLFVWRSFTQMAPTLSIVLAVVLLILPGMDFGEREHVLLIFTFPYFFAAIYRLQGHRLHPLLAFAVGLLAILGFALKPYFLLAMALVEGYGMWYTRNICNGLRVEVVTAFVFLLSYVLFIFMVHRDYIDVVVPTAMQFYYSGFGDSWRDLLINDLMLFCVGSMLFCWYQSKQISNTMPYMVFLLAMLGFMGSYLWQQVAWAYHMLPVVALALLLIVILLTLAVKEPKKNGLSLVLSTTLACCFAVGYIKNSYEAGLNYKASQRQLMTFLRQHARHQPVYFISASPREIFPAVVEAQAIYASRLLHLFWFPAIVKKGHVPYFNREEKALVQLIVDDIVTKKPQWVFVDSKKQKAFFHGLNFDYLRYLLGDSRFRAAWQRYHHVMTIEEKSPNFMVYQYEIYQRV